MSRLTVAVLLAAALAGTTGCSVKRFAVNRLGDSLAGSGTTYTGDDDPDLIGQALPFSLKLIESLLAQSPNHRGMLVAAASGFTAYGHGYVEQDADIREATDFEAARAMRARARRLYLRARDYGLRALAVRHPGVGAALEHDPVAALKTATRDDVPALYWTAAALGSAIGLSKDTPDLIAEQRIVEALIDRALALDPDFDSGAIHAFLISYEPARQGAAGTAEARSRAHFERAVALTGGGMAAPYVALAEAIAVQKQDRAEFHQLIERALAVDADATPAWRLANLLSQRRARWLRARETELFAE